MAVLAADVYLPHQSDAVKDTVYCGGADIFYKGAVVWALAAGTASVVPVAGARILGICTHQQTTLAAGDPVEIFTAGTFSFPALTGVATAEVGSPVVYDAGTLITDNPADAVSLEDVTPAADDAMLGRLLRIENSRCVIQITGLVGLKYDATAAAWT